MHFNFRDKNRREKAIIYFLDFYKLSSKYGLELYPFFGTLLGIIRDNDLIPHDNDIDLIYVGSNSNFTKICKDINNDKSNKFNIIRNQNNQLITFQKEDIKIDLYFFQQVDDQFYGSSFDKKYRVLKQHLLPLDSNNLVFKNTNIRCINDPKSWLSYYYGEDWDIPKINFKHKKQPEDKETIKNYWQNYYTNSKSTDQPSAFCDFIVSKYNYILKDLDLIDICSGNGRDTYSLANYCSNITGIDFAVKPEPIEKVSFFKQDACSFLKDKNNVNIYSRFGLHAFDEVTENFILDKSNYVFLEFRAKEDTDFCPDHYRRRIDGDKFLSKLINKNFTILFYCKSKGLATYKDYDPMIIRTIAIKKVIK